jgi:hypothetical protein
MKTDIEPKSAPSKPKRVAGGDSLDRLVGPLLCFATQAHGVTSYVWATTAGKAIAATVRQANDAGYRTHWVQVKCRRHAVLDDYDLMDRKIRPNRCYSPDHIAPNVRDQGSAPCTNAANQKDQSNEN